MNMQGRQVFFQEREFRKVWDRAPSNTHLLRGLKNQERSPREILNEAAHFLGGALLSDGFVLFQNGGLPQIERRFGPLIEEILLRTGPTASDDGSVPIRVCLHLNHAQLQSTRMRYWASPTRAPSSVASLDLGQLEIPPCWVIWNIGNAHSALVELVDWVNRLALPWFGAFSNERELHRRLFRCEIPGIGLDTALELVISEFGAFEGARFLEQCILNDKRIGPQVREQSIRIMRAQERGMMGSDMVSNIAAVTASFRLIGR